jgi:hypothetical protein
MPINSNARLSAADGKTATGRLVEARPPISPLNRLRVFCWRDGKASEIREFQGAPRPAYSATPQQAALRSRALEFRNAPAGICRPALSPETRIPQNGMGSEYREASVDKVPFTPHSEETCLLGRRAGRDSAMAPVIPSTV